MKRKLVILLLIGCCLSLCTCGTKINLDGVYNFCWDQSVYIEFNDGEYKTNFPDFEEADLSGSYSVENNQLILELDSFDAYYFGYIYRDYICTLFEGILPTSYEGDSEISLQITEDFLYKIIFQNNKYKAVSLWDDHVDIINEGTFEIDGDTLICNGQNEAYFLLLGTSDGVYHTTYTKK